MSAADVKRSMEVGAQYDVTNHYITREDHACFGTRRATIHSVNDQAFTLAQAMWRSRTEWPKAAQIEQDPDGTIRLYGGGASQQPGDLFLTLVPVNPFTVKTPVAARSFDQEAEGQR